MKFPPINDQMDILRRGVEEIIPEEELVSKLEKSIKKSQPLEIKLGCDIDYSRSIPSTRSSNAE